MSNHDLRLLRSNGAEQDQVLGRRKGFGLFLGKILIHFGSILSIVGPLKNSILQLPTFWRDGKPVWYSLVIFD